MTGALHLDWIDYAERLIGGGAIDWASPSAVAGLINKAQALLPSDLVILPVARMLRAIRSPATEAASPKGAQPLRALLADAAVRAKLLETVAMMMVPALALGLPTPGLLAAQAAEKIGALSPDMDEDLVDDAALYVADFLRIFANARIEGVVLTGTDSFPSLSAPIQKVAQSYGWKFSDDGLWDGVRTVRIAVDAEPEAVLAQVRALRSQGGTV